MWRYLVLNSLWFSILFLVHFFGSEKDRRMMLVFIFAAAGLLAFKSVIDPFVWFYYLAFSLLVFYGSGQFRRWAMMPSALMAQEIDTLSKKMKKEKLVLDEILRRDEALSRQAEELSEFYMKVNEMSKSLDHFETFLIFAQTLSGRFKFDVMKLAFFEDAMETPHSANEIYEINENAFRGVFDRSLLLKDRKKIQGTVYPFDQALFRRLASERRPLQLADMAEEMKSAMPLPKPFAAYPVFLEDKMFAALTVVGIEEKDILLLQFLIERFISELQRVKLYEKVETLATTDGLTGVFVRRHLLERLAGEVDRVKRFVLKLSFLMIDVDHFKNFNDSYGHLVGDVVLKEVAQTIQKNIREVDLVGRYGGEEFGVLLVETGESEAFLVAERIRRSIEEKEFRAYDENLKITVSVGCASYSPKRSEVRASDAIPSSDAASYIVESADAALYQAKHLGRNKVCIFHPPS